MILLLVTSYLIGIDWTIPSVKLVRAIYILKYVQVLSGLNHYCFKLSKLLNDIDKCVDFFLCIYLSLYNLCYFCHYKKEPIRKPVCPNNPVLLYLEMVTQVL